MSYGICDNCEEFVNLLTHKCKTEWQIRVIGFHGDDEYEKAFGYTAGDAVKCFVERNWPDMDFTLEAEVFIRKLDCQWRRFDINVEMVPEFYINENYTNEKFVEQLKREGRL